MSLDEFISHDQYNLEHILAGLPHVRGLMEKLDGLYDSARSLMPPVGDEPKLICAQCLTLCHKGLLGAAATIGRRHPDDAGPVTRRVIEAAALSISVKHDVANVERWKAEDKIKYPEHPTLEELRRFKGDLSDVVVHFTPGFVARRPWRHEVKDGLDFMGFAYSEPHMHVIADAFATLSAIHLRVIALFDECFDRAFSQNHDWEVRWKDAQSLHKVVSTWAKDVKAKPEEGDSHGSTQ